MIDKQDINKDVNVILKTNDYGTLETLSSQISKLTSNEKEISVNIIDTGVGQINQNDIHNAQISNSIILAMDTDITAEAV